MVGATVAGALLLFGITVFVHEWGHFIAARLTGLYVDRFAIGMGPVLWSFRHRGVQYSINWLPLGGYVSLPQMAPMEVVEGKAEGIPDDLPPANPWAKMVTAFFGPLFSMLLAVVLAIGVTFAGKKQNVTTLTTTIGYIETGSPAARAGMLPGDRILTINGEEVTQWLGAAHSVEESIILCDSNDVTFAVDRDGQQRTFVVTRSKDADPRMENLKTVGFEKYWAQPLVIKRLEPGYPAAQAGLQAGDTITFINGQKLYSPRQVREIIKQSHGMLAVEFNRSGQDFRVSVMPPKWNEEQKDSLIGIEWKSDFYRIVYPGPLQQIEDSLSNMGRTLKALISPQSGVTIRHMSGPVGIFDLIIRLFRNADFRALLSFWVFFNVNLAVFNLLPIPVLDGGHIVMSLYEIVLRRSINARALNVVVTCCFFALIFFVLLVTYYDVGRIGRNWKEDGEIAKTRHTPAAETHTDK